MAKALFSQPTSQPSGSKEPADEDQNGRVWEGAVEREAEGPSTTGFLTWGRMRPTSPSARDSQAEPTPQAPLRPASHRGRQTREVEGGEETPGIIVPRTCPDAVPPDVHEAVC